MNVYRGGCIICMDYGRYTETENYVRLVRQFEPIVEILTAFLYELNVMGFSMNRGYMFGFSYGGQLVCEAGRRIGIQSIADIDSKHFCFFHLISLVLQLYFNLILF